MIITAATVTNHAVPTLRCKSNAACASFTEVGQNACLLGCSTISLPCSSWSWAKYATGNLYSFFLVANILNPSCKRKYVMYIVEETFCNVEC